MSKRQKELEDKDKLITAWIWELKFANMEIEILLCLLDEIKAITNDNLVKMLIDNWVERYNIDKMCHTRALFTNKW